jgi:hypothetical protein
LPLPGICGGLGHSCGQAALLASHWYASLTGDRYGVLRVRAEGLCPGLDGRELWW